MTAMLKNVIKSGTGAAANIGKPAAGKTGTTDDYKDASFIGYTPDVVTGVWVGNDDNTTNSKAIQGGTVPALIWRDVMKVATAPYKNADFDYPEVELIDRKAPVEKPKEEEQENKENTENSGQSQENTPDTSDTIRPAVTPADAVKNFKQVQTEKQNAEQTPAPAPQPQAPVPQPKAPVPVPMAVPESLH